MFRRKTLYLFQITIGDEDMSEVLNDMNYSEKKFFGVTSEMESEDWL